MLVRDGSTVRTWDLKCLCVTSRRFLRRTRSTFSGVTTVGTRVEGLLERTLPCWRKLSTYFENSSVVWKNCTISNFEMRLEGASRGHKTILLWRNASTRNERCCALHRCTMNEFLDLAQPVLWAAVVSWIPIERPIFSYKLSYFIPISPKLTEWYPFQIDHLVSLTLYNKYWSLH